MGNGASQQADGEDSAFTLSKDLQAKIVQDFNNEQVAKMFGKQVYTMEETKLEKLRASREERAKLSAYMEQFREQNKQLQSNLDSTIESLEDRLTDLGNVVEYDAGRLEAKYLGDKSALSKGRDVSCLRVRANVGACFAANGKDISACEGLVKVLEDCASKAITTTVA